MAYDIPLTHPKQADSSRRRMEQGSARGSTIKAHTARRLLPASHLMWSWLSARLLALQAIHDQRVGGTPKEYRRVVLRIRSMALARGAVRRSRDLFMECGRAAFPPTSTEPASNVVADPACGRAAGAPTDAHFSWGLAGGRAAVLHISGADLRNVSGAADRSANASVRRCTRHTR